MSIYPVRLSEWFPPGEENHDTMKLIVSSSKCLHCDKKRVHWQKAWGHHSLPWGNGDVWCNEKHYRNYLKKS